MLMLASILFHHSNLRLPRWLERPLAQVIATPRLHALHHSVDAAERATNFSSGLVVWDQLHGSHLYAEREVRVGLPSDVEVSDVRATSLPTQPPAPVSTH